MKLIDQWDALKAEIRRMEHEAAIAAWDGKPPTRLYYVTHNGDIEESEIIYYGHEHAPTAVYLGSNPTRQDVADLRNRISSGDLSPDKSEIILYWRRVCKHYTESGACRAPDIGRGHYTERAEALARATEIKRRIHTEIDMAANGYIRCSYCSKMQPPESILYARIWSPNWAEQGGQSEPRPYCKGTDCAVHDQMSHEG